MARLQCSDCRCQKRKLFLTTLCSCSRESTPSSLKSDHLSWVIALVTGRVHRCKRDAGFWALDFVFKQCRLNDNDFLLLVKVWIPCAVFQLLLSLSQSIILYTDKQYGDAVTRVHHELIDVADNKSMYYSVLARIRHDMLRRSLLVFSAGPVVFSSWRRMDRARPL